MSSGSLPPSETPVSTVTRIVRGVVLLGRGNALGLTAFRNEPEAVLSALAPSFALFVVLLIAQIVQGYSAVEITKILLLIATLLVGLVLSHSVAKLWGKETGWMRYAAASLWCNWLPVVLSLLLICIMQLILPGAIRARPVMMVVLASIELYALWLSWFVTRSGLGIGSGKAALLVFLTRLAITALYGLAVLLPPHYNALKEALAPLTHH